jgi:hypothetical protein
MELTSHKCCIRMEENTVLYEDHKAVRPYVGLILGSYTKSELGVWMRNYASQQNFSVKVSDNGSSKRRYKWICASTVGCAVHVTVDMAKSGIWVVSHCDLDHQIDCDSVCRPKQGDIARLAKGPIETGKGKREGLSTTVAEYLRNEHRIVIDQTDQNAGRRIRRAVQWIAQSRKSEFENNFIFLKGYLKNLACANANDVVCFTESEHNRFQRAFLMLDAQVKVATLSKPHVSYDGGYMRHELWSGYTCIVCGGSDGEDRNTILSVSINPSECKNDVLWHIECQKKHPVMKKFLEQENLLVVTDQGTAIYAAIKTALPKCAHILCRLHILNNISAPSLRGEPLTVYWRCVTAGSRGEFEASLLELERLHYGAAQVIKDLRDNSSVGCARFVTFAIPDAAAKWFILTNNTCEHAMKELLKLRRMDPTSFFMNYVSDQGQLYATRLEEDNAWVSGGSRCLTRIAKKSYDCIRDTAAQHYTCAKCSSTNYSVWQGKKQLAPGSGTSDFQKVSIHADILSCSCIRNNGLACVHVYTVLKKEGKLADLMDPSKPYTHSCYYTANVSRMYDSSFSVCGEIDIRKSVLLPPMCKNTGKYAEERGRMIMNMHTNPYAWKQSGRRRKLSYLSQHDDVIDDSDVIYVEKRIAVSPLDAGANNNNGSCNNRSIRIPCDVDNDRFQIIPSDGNGNCMCNTLLNGNSVINGVGEYMFTQPPDVVLACKVPVCNMMINRLLSPYNLEDISDRQINAKEMFYRLKAMDLPLPVKLDQFPPEICGGDWYCTVAAFVAIARELFLADRTHLDANALAYFSVSLRTTLCCWAPRQPTGFKVCCDDFTRRPMYFPYTGSTTTIHLFFHAGQPPILHVPANGQPLQALDSMSDHFDLLITTGTPH